MNIASSAAVQAATSGAQSATSDEVSVLVLRKALQSQAAVALGLIAALPPVPAAPPLATTGTVGTQVNTFA